jgi:endo-1,4-beta-mannosidase
MMFRVGINYWPVSSAMYWWQRFDRIEVEQDFARIKNAGFDSVRIFLQWEDFQPRPRIVSEKALDNLAIVADVAQANRLSVLPTLFTGHMSGANWIPEWALDRVEAGGAQSRFRTVSGGRVVRGNPKNWYTDERILDAQLRLARRIAARLHDAQNIWAYDLGNENSNCVIPPSREAAVHWLGAVAGEIRSVSPQRAITIGLHMEDLEEDRKLGPAEAARVSDFLCMHGYPIYSAWSDGPVDAMLLPFLGAITRWLGSAGMPGGTGVPDVVFEEFGAPTVPAHGHSGAGDAVVGVPLLEEGEAALFTRNALESLHEFGFIGAMIWCFGDYARLNWSQPPLDQSRHERSFGLWREDHSAKPAVAQIQRFSGVNQRPWLDGFDWIELETSEFYKNPAYNLRYLYRRFREVWPVNPQVTE